MRTMLFNLTIVGLLSAAPVLAQQNPEPPAATQPEPAHRARQNRQSPPLSGPKVEVTEAPGAAMSFGGEAGQVARVNKSNLRQYATILKAMELSEAQRRQAEAIIREYGEAVRAYQEEHAAELRQLREVMIRESRGTNPRAAGAAVSDQAPPRRPGATDARPARPTDRATDRPATRTAPPTDARPDAPADAPRRPLAGQRPGAGQADWPVQSKEAREAMERLMEIRKATPPQEPYMKRLYELLTGEQKAEFDRRIEELYQAQMEQQMQRRLAAAGVNPEAMQQMDGMQRGEDGRPIVDESQFTPQMRERLRRMRLERRKMLENRERQNPTPPSPDDIEFEKPHR